MFAQRKMRHCCSSLYSEIAGHSIMLSIGQSIEPSSGQSIGLSSMSLQRCRWKRNSFISKKGQRHIMRSEKQRRDWRATQFPGQKSISLFDQLKKNKSQVLEWWRYFLIFKTGIGKEWRWVWELGRGCIAVWSRSGLDSCCRHNAIWWWKDDERFAKHPVAPKEFASRTNILPRSGLWT